MPTCFISYSWDNDAHKKWVAQLAADLRNSGVETIIDQWHLALGDPMPEFMEKSISENDYVLIVCTPKYQTKSNQREGGVGYEGDIITAEIFGTRNHRKFIPILRSGTWNNSLPVWLKGKLGVDLSGNPYSQEEYDDLVATLHNKTKKVPPIINNPIQQTKVIVEKREAQNISADNAEDIKIVGIIKDGVTQPKNDGTRGSALYMVPFKLSRPPSDIWSRLFIEAWNHPPRFTSMHRPGIASVYYDRIELNGTTLDEVKDVHRDTLVLAVDIANKNEKEHNQRLIREEERRNREHEEHQNRVSALADEIDFD